MHAPRELTRQAGRAQAAVLLLGSCLPVMAAVLIAPVLPRILAHFQSVPHAAVLVPVMLTVPSLIVGLLAPFVGGMVDRLGRTRTLMAGMVLYLFAGTAPLWLESLQAIIISRAVVGLAEAAIMTCCTTLIGDYYSGERGERLLAQQTMYSSLSATLFFLVGGALGEMGWRTPFWLYGLASAALLPAMFILLWEPTNSAGLLQRHDAARRPFPWRAIAPICGVTLLAAIAFYLVPVHMGFFLDAMGDGAPQRVGQAIGISSVAVVIGAGMYGPLSRLGVARHLTLGFALLAAGFFWLQHAQVYQVAVAAAFLGSLGAGAVLPTLLNWAMRRLHFEDRGRGTGAFMASFFLGQFVCPLVVMALGQLTGQGLRGAIGAYAWALTAMALVALALGYLLRGANPATTSPATLKT